MTTRKHRIALGILIGLATALFAVPSGAAHPSAVAFTGASGTRCYYFDWHETGDREFWLETNGVHSGGEPEPQEWFGLPPVDGVTGSGLQRSPTTLPNGQTLAADTLLSNTEWAALCLK